MICKYCNNPHHLIGDTVCPIGTPYHTKPHPALEWSINERKEAKPKIVIDGDEMVTYFRSINFARMGGGVRW